MVSNLVIFHWDGSARDANFLAIHEPSSSCDWGGYGSSEAMGMLLMFTVSFREIIVMAKVALNPGSSQQGKARRAAVGWRRNEVYNENDMYGR